MATRSGDSAARMLAARAEVIERILKSAEMHELDETVSWLRLVSMRVPQPFIEKPGISSTEVGEALATSIRRYLTELGAFSTDVRGDVRR